MKQLSEEEISALMADVLAGESSQAEADALKEWIAEDPAHAEEFAQLKSYWNAEMEDRFSIDPKKDLDRLMKRVRKSERKGQVSYVKSLWITVAVAASLLIGVVAGWNFKKQDVVLSKQYTCMTGGSISKFQLSDGTEVWLNKNSRLEYTGKYGKEERRVRLIGEGFFDVKPMADCKFIVDLDGADVTVKGTAFDAFNNQESGLKGAALIRGKIGFESGTQSIELAPNRQVVYDSINNDLTVSPFDAALVTAWKDHLFRYRSLTFEELVNEVISRYEISIVIDDLQDQDGTYSGALDLGLPPANVLELICMQNGSSWSKIGDTYHISRN